jgi:hypothetical protein
MERAYDEVKAKAFVQRALRDVGWIEDPPGSNHGSLADGSMLFVNYPRSPISEKGPPYCAATTCLWAYDSGIKNGPRTASTGGIHDWGIAHGAIVAEPRMGDMVLLTDPASPTGFHHTAVCVHHFAGEDFIHTVEANLSNGVRVNTRPISAAKYVRAY